MPYVCINTVNPHSIIILMLWMRTLKCREVMEYTQDSQLDSSEVAVKYNGLGEKSVLIDTFLDLFIYFFERERERSFIADSVLKWPQ